MLLWDKIVATYEHLDDYLPLYRVPRRKVQFSNHKSEYTMWLMNYLLPNILFLTKEATKLFD